MKANALLYFISKYSSVVFITCLIIVCFIYNYHQIIRLRPRSVHQWRQTDCASIALNYYGGNMNFFHPEMHWRGRYADGKFIEEFPIIYYLVAMLWKIFGYHEFIFRLINLSIVFAGLFALKKMLYTVLINSFWSIYVPLFLFTSPVLVYYSNNFLVDAPSLGFVLIGWFYFWKYYTTGKNIFLWITMFFFLLGGLLKITSFASYLTLFIIFIIEKLTMRPFKKTWNTFRGTFLTIIPFMLVAVLGLLWYLFAISYNKESYFGMWTWPIWKIDYNSIKTVIYLVNENIIPFLFSGSAFTLLFILVLFIIYHYKQSNRFLVFILFLLLGGYLFYCILWFQVFNVHDYYSVVLFILPVFIFLVFLDILKNYYPAIYNSSFIKFLFIAILIYNIYYCAEKTKVRYFNYGSWIIGENEKNYWTWFHWNYSAYLEPFETVTPYLRSLGIKREDKVISIPVNSPNTSLYLMDQKGWTSFGFPANSESNIAEMIRKGAKYLIISNPDIYKEDYIQPFIKKKIGTYKIIDIYSLSGKEL